MFALIKQLTRRVFAPLQPLERVDPPVVFSEPENTEAWATRAMLGEEMWIARHPLDRAMALNGAATALALGGVWGAIKRRPLPTLVCAVGQVAMLLAYWCEMASTTNGTAKVRDVPDEINRSRSLDGSNGSLQDNTVQHAPKGRSTQWNPG